MCSTILKFFQMYLYKKQHVYTRSPPGNFKFRDFVLYVSTTPYVYEQKGMMYLL